MARKTFVVVGATDNTEKYGNQVLKSLKRRTYEAYPANPMLKELAGVQCYPSLADIPVKVDVVDLVVSPEVTGTIIRDCRQLELNRIWLKAGSESEATIDYYRENNMKVVDDVCARPS